MPRQKPRSLRTTLPNTRPDRDAFLVQSFTPRSLADRKQNRSMLLATEKWGHGAWPIVFIPLALLNEKGRALLVQLLPALSDRAMHVVILGDDAQHYDAGAENIHCEKDSEEQFHRMLAAADIMMLPGTPIHGQRAALLAWRYGAIPVLAEDASPNGVADNYDPVLESGAAFLADRNDAWGYFGALVRALETYRLPYDWKGMQRTGFEQTWN